MNDGGNSSQKKQPFTSIHFHGTGPTPLGSRLIDGTGTNADADAMTNPQYGLSN